MAEERQSDIVKGAVWRHRRNRDRHVQVTGVEGGWVFVHGKQPIAVTTLLRDYEFVAAERTYADVADINFPSPQGRTGGDDDKPDFDSPSAEGTGF